MGNSEPGAAAPGDRARDDGDGRVQAARLLCGRPAPEHAAPHGAAEPVPGRLVTRMREPAMANPRRGRRYIMDLLRKERGRSERG